MAAIGYHWLPWLSSTFYAQFTWPHSTTRPNAIRTTYSSTLTNTDHHSSMGRTKLARKHCCLPSHGLSLMNLDFEHAPCSSSPVRPRLTAATATPSRCPVYHLQMQTGARQHSFSSPRPPRRHALRNTFCCARGAFLSILWVPQRLSEWRVQRACSVYEA